MPTNNLKKAFDRRARIKAKQRMEILCWELWDIEISIQKNRKLTF